MWRTGNLRVKVLFFHVPRWIQHGTVPYGAGFGMKAATRCAVPDPVWKNLHVLRHICIKALSENNTLGIAV